MRPPDRPVPVPNAETAPYWEAARRHQLVLPYCSGCRRHFPPPSTLCATCRRRTSTWRPVPGTGSVWSCCTTHLQVVSGYDPPYVVALVELDDADGVRLLANVLGCEPGDVHIGSRVVPAFEERGPVTLPQFRLAGGAGAR